MPEKLPSKAEKNELNARDFDGKLNELKFDDNALQNEIYGILANTGGYSLIKGEIKGKGDASKERINVWDLDDYIQEQGGKKFLKEIYDRGVVGLRKDFERSKKKLRKNIAVLQSDKNDFKTRNFKESKLAEKIRKVAEESGVDLDDLTFEQAFAHNLFGNYLRPTMKGVAEYGLTWFEYNNRVKRKAALQRKAQSSVVSEGVGVREYAIDSKGPEQRLDPPKVVKPKPESKPKETPNLTLDSARKDLLTVGKPYLENLLKTVYSKANLRVEIANNGLALKVLDGENHVTAINIMREPIGRVFFSCNYQNFDVLNKSLNEAEGQIKRFVDRKKHEDDDKKGRKANLEKQEIENWRKRAEEFILSVDGFKDGNKMINVAKDSSGYATYFGSVRVKSNVIIRVGSVSYNGEINVDNKSLILRSPLVLSGPNGVNKVYEFRPIPLNDLSDKKKLVAALVPLHEKFVSQQ